MLTLDKVMLQGVHNICVSFSDYILTLDMVMLQDVHYIYVSFYDYDNFR